MTIDIERGRYWDRAWNPITGCTPCSPACKNCWAADMVARFPHLHGLEPDGTPIPFSNMRFHLDRLGAPTRWRTPQVVAVSWLGDMFHDDSHYKWLNNVLNLIQNTPRHIFLLLTKRPQYLTFTAPDNALVGVTAWDQESFCTAVVALEDADCFGHTWISVEPILGPINVRRAIAGGWRAPWWIVAGGETGSRARPAELDWFRRIRDDCAEFGIPFFLKSLGAGRGRVLDGRTHDEFPPVLTVN